MKVLQVGGFREAYHCGKKGALEMLDETSTDPRTNCGLSADAEGSPLDDVEMTAWRTLRSATGRLMTDLNRDLVDSADISLSEYEILVRLSEAPDGRLRMSSLAAQTDLSRSRLTHTVSRLEARDLVQRFTCDSDLRGVHCRLTEVGHSFLAAAAPGHLLAVKRYLLDYFSHDQLRELTRLLTRIGE